MNKSILILLVVLVGCATYDAKRFPMQSAAYDGDIQKIHDLIKSGVSLNTQDQDGFTPLLAASSYLHWDIAKAIVEAGADVNIRENSGMTALDFAVLNGRLDMVNYFIDHDAQIEKNIKSGATPLTTAAANGQWTIAKRLVDLGFDVDSSDSNGITPLLYAVSYCQPDVVDFLLDKGARVDVKDQEGSSAAHYAVYYCEGSFEKGSRILSSLISHGADISSPDNKGKSPYSEGMENYLINMVAALRRNGVTERFGGRPPVDLKIMAAEDCNYFVDGERSAGAPMWILGPIGYGIAAASDSVKIPKKYQECMAKMGFNTIEP